MFILTSVALTGCATFFPKNAVKAPCGPTAGFTDPCGNRLPINTPQGVEDAQDLYISNTLKADV